jgi:hypothetical protein
MSKEKNPLLADHENLPSKTVSIELNATEQEILTELLSGGIGSYRNQANVNFVLGKMSKETLEWSMGYADHIETLAKKIFPDWRT